jgi:hypothetical protein
VGEGEEVGDAAGRGPGLFGAGLKLGGGRDVRAPELQDGGRLHGWWARHPHAEEAAVAVVVGVMPRRGSFPFGGRRPMGAMVGADRPVSMAMVGAMSMVGGVDVAPMVFLVPGELGSPGGLPVCCGLPMG